jgi:L,D-transpeptidase ErfK/SrfK
MWLPGEGTDIVVPGRRILPPGPREGIVINLPEHRLYYYPPAAEGTDPVVLTFPVNVGRLGRSSPLGVTEVIGKEVRPSWFPPASIRKEHAANGDPLPAVVRPGRKNPLGKLALRLAAGKGTYLIHGTNTPWAIGMEITHGCVSMYPEDVAVLYQRVPIGTKVWVLNAPVKVAYVDGEVLAEVHPPVSREGQPENADIEQLARDLASQLGEHAASVQWDLARKVLDAQNGVPTVVSVPDAMSAGETAMEPIER